MFQSAKHEEHITRQKNALQNHFLIEHRTEI